MDCVGGECDGNMRCAMENLELMKTEVNKEDCKGMENDDDPKASHDIECKEVIKEK